VVLFSLLKIRHNTSTEQCFDPLTAIFQPFINIAWPCYTFRQS
jgi:hypothetical protein